MACKTRGDSWRRHDSACLRQDSSKRHKRNLSNSTKVHRFEWTSGKLTTRGFLSGYKPNRTPHTTIYSSFSWTQTSQIFLNQCKSIQNHSESHWRSDFPFFIWSSGSEMNKLSHAWCSSERSANFSSGSTLKKSHKRKGEKWKKLVIRLIWLKKIIEHIGFHEWNSDYKLHQKWQVRAFSSEIENSKDLLSQRWVWSGQDKVKEPSAS